MTPATAAAPVRLGLTAIVLASLAAFAVAGRADGAVRSWSAYLAPAAAACQGSADRFLRKTGIRSRGFRSRKDP